MARLDSNRSYYLLAKTETDRVAIVKLGYIISHRNDIKNGEVGDYHDFERIESVEKDIHLPKSAKLYNVSLSLNPIQKLVGHIKSCTAGEAAKRVVTAGQVEGFDSVVVPEEVVQDELVDLKPKSMDYRWTDCYDTFRGIRLENNRIITTSSDGLTECHHTGKTEPPTSERGLKIKLRDWFLDEGTTRKARCKNCGREY